MARGRPCKDGKKNQAKNIKLPEELSRDSQSPNHIKTETKGAAKTPNSSQTIGAQGTTEVVGSITSDEFPEGQEQSSSVEVFTIPDGQGLGDTAEDGEKVVQLQKDDVAKEIEKWKHAIILYELVKLHLLKL
ncbi:hypothetical protein HAX54_031075 [Datura stramonium]|uniref:Uncharacterized protein n=1 Tax=Datura stramonium TaxID=4076 RepID=A0ABS8SBP1_DATST|nr:hypothetical protein [Datura stramonium]